MDVSTISQKTGINQNAVKYLVNHKIISNELTDGDNEFMTRLSKVWGKPKFVKLQISRYNLTERARIVLTAGLDDIESYLLSLWIGHYCDREDYKTSLHLEQVVDITINCLGLSTKPSMRNKIKLKARRMRTKARNLYYRYTRPELVEIMNALTLHKKSRKPAKKRQVAANTASAEKKRQAMLNIFGDGPISLANT